ncbi:MAG: MFS transporter [Chloroflexota bacterium]
MKEGVVMEGRRRSHLGYEFGLVTLLTLMWGFVGLNRIGIGFLLPPIVKEFHLAYWQASLFISGTSITWAISTWIGGTLSDRIGRKGVLLVGMYAGVIFSALMGAAWNFLSFFIVRDLLGLGDGVGWPVGQSVIAEDTTPSRRALYQGLFAGGYTVVGVGVGGLIITHLAASFGWRPVFPILAVFGAATVTALAWWMKPTARKVAAGSSREPSVARFFRDTATILRIRGVGFLIVAQCLILGWLNLFNGFAALYLTRVRHFPLTVAGSVLAVGGIVGFVGQLVLPALSDRIGRKPVIYGAAVVGGLAPLLFALLGASPVVLAAIVAVGGLCAWGLLPIVSATCIGEVAGPDHHGAALGVANFFAVVIGTTLFPFLGGVASDAFGLATPILASGVAVLLIGLAMVGVPETAPLVRERIALRAAQP